MQNIGFIGVGIMGTPMVRCLLKAGFPVNVYDRRETQVAPLVEEGVVAKNSPKEVAESSDIVITMLPNSMIVDSVMFDENGLFEGLTAGKVFIDMSSADYHTNQRICLRLKDKGVEMLDAPVTGSSKGATEGTLTIMVGGEESTLEKVRPVLEAMGSKIIHVGPVGTADIAKACNQMLFALNLAAASEVFALAAKAGLDPEMLLSIANNGSGESYASRVKFDKFVLKRNFKAGFTTNLMAKDVDIALSMARNLQVPMRMGDLARETLRIAQNKGYGLDDCSGMVRIIEDETNVTVEPFNKQ